MHGMNHAKECEARITGIIGWINSRVGGRARSLYATPPQPPPPPSPPPPPPTGFER